MNTNSDRSSGRRPPVWAGILIVLVFANLAWMMWRWIDDAAMRTFYKQFRVSSTNDNDVAIIGISELKTGRLIWTKSRFVNRGSPVEEHDFYFSGEKLFSVWSKSNQPPVYSVFFRHPGKGVTWWQNRAGADIFTQRTFYDDDGTISRDEVWYAQAWHVVDRRQGTNGIIVNGQWYRLGFDTNGFWTVESLKE